MATLQFATVLLCRYQLIYYTVVTSMLTFNTLVTQSYFVDDPKLCAYVFILTLYC